MGLGYFHNCYRGKPVLRKGGVLILTATPATTPSITSSTPATSSSSTACCPRPGTRWCCGTSTRRSSPATPATSRCTGAGNAYHGAHPFFMWYWGENGRQHVGKVIVAGAENAHVPARLGWERAESLTEAIAMARSFTGPVVVHHHDAPPAAGHGGRGLTDLDLAMQNGNHRLVPRRPLRHPPADPARASPSASRPRPVRVAAVPARDLPGPAGLHPRGHRLRGQGAAEHAARTASRRWGGST